jgi:hypothetical protein
VGWVLPKTCPQVGLRIPASAFSDQGKAVAPVSSGECSYFAQDGEDWVWCREVPVEEGINAFNRRSPWQITLAQPLSIQSCVSYLTPGL